MNVQAVLERAFEGVAEGRYADRDHDLMEALRRREPMAAERLVSRYGNRAYRHYIVRHMNLDPGSLGADDQLQNVRAVREGTRVFSAYDLRDGTRIWIITEADRSVTTILLPEGY
jgi:hypothetical protein